MSKIHVSQTATTAGGITFGVGSDANSRTTAADPLTPILTLAQALAVAAAFDKIILNNGTYTHTTHFAPTDLALTIEAAESRRVILQCASVTRVVHIAAAGDNCTLRGVIVDCNGVTGSCLTTDSSVAMENIILDDVELLDFTAAGLSSIVLSNFTCINGTKLSSTSCNSGIIINVPAAATAGTILIENPVFNLSGVAGNGISIVPAAGATNIISKVSGVTGTFTGTSATVIAVNTLGCAESHIFNCGKLVVISGSGLKVGNDPNAGDAYVYDNVGLTGGQEATSFGIRMGENTSDANNHSLTVKRFDNNHVSGFDHSLQFSYITGAKGFNCSSDDGAIGALIKGGINCEFVSVLTTRMTAQYLQLKGCVGCNISNSTYVLSAGYTGVGLTANVDIAVNNATSFFNNINGVSEVDFRPLVSIGVTQDVTINTHNLEKVVPISGPVYTVGASQYTTVAQFNIDALVNNCTEVATGNTDRTTGDYNLKSSSLLVGTGTRFWTSSNPLDANNNPFSDIDCDPGHIQSTHSPLHPGN